MTSLLLAGIGFVAAVGFSPAQDKKADDRVKVELLLATEHVPKDLKAGARVDLRLITGKKVPFKGPAVYTSELWAANFEVASVTAVEKPASPEEAVRVQLFVAKDKAKGVENLRDTRVQVTERQADGSFVRKKIPLTLRLELSKGGNPGPDAGIKVEGIKVRPDKDNVVASKLEGNWVRDPDISKRLSKNWLRGFGGGEVVSFKSDSSAAARIPEKYHRFFADKRVYMAGTLTFTTAGKPQEAVFLLVELKGNSHVFWLPMRDGETNSFPRDFRVMLVTAAESENDLLFIGVFNQPHFTAYQRGKAK